MNINKRFRYDPFNFFQGGQIKETLGKKKLVATTATSAIYWIYENKKLMLKHGDEVCYYLKVKLLDDKLFTKLYHFMRLENDTNYNRLKIAEEEFHVFDIRNFLLRNNFTFRALGQYEMRRARSHEFAQYRNVPNVGRVIAFHIGKNVWKIPRPTQKTFEEYIH